MCSCYCTTPRAKYMLVTSKAVLYQLQGQGEQEYNNIVIIGNVNVDVLKLKNIRY